MKGIFYIMQEKIYQCECGKVFTQPMNYAKHIQHLCPLNPDFSACKYCGKKQSDKYLLAHEPKCLKNPDRIKAPSAIKYLEHQKLNNQPRFCIYCGKFCKNLPSESNHLRYCRKNPANFEKYAEIDRRKAETLQLKTCKSHRPGYASTPEKEVLRRQHISETMKKNPKAGGKRHGSGRGKKGWYKGYFCDSTYELVYIIYNIDHNIPFKRCDLEYTYSYKGEIHKYYPDFELPDGSLIETKGYHTELVDVKIAAVKDRNITVLYEKDLAYAFQWVKDNYTYDQLSDLYT